MVSSSPGQHDDVPEETSFAPIDDKGRRIIVLLGQNGLIEKTELTSIGSLSIRLVNMPGDHYALEILDNSNLKVPLQFSFSNDAGKGEKPYFNTVALNTPEHHTAAQPFQYMPLLDRAINELQGLKNTNT